MRNLKRALSLGLTAAMISGLMVMGSSAASYADVTSENNVEAIEVLESVGIMIGDENGNFNPDQNVTRNEMAVVMSNLMEYNVASYKDTSPFTDVPSWAEPYVAACYTNGITAGYSDTIYGGSDTVTTAQAALMLMKALGYFQYSSDFGGDWQLATTRQGNAIDLFVGVDSGVTQAMTRNDVAQLVLNTLRAGTVEASTDGSWSIGDVTINNNVTYSFITSNQTYATAIDDARSTSNNSDAQRSIVELGEQLYMGDLKLNDEATDVFGRPARYWEYDGTEIGTYAKTELLRESYTVKVTGRDLYDLLGSNIVDTYDFDITIDGVSDYDINKAIFDQSAINRNNRAGVGKTGNGVLTEVYVDTDEKQVDIAIINTYLAIATDDYNESQDEVSLDVYGVLDTRGEYVKTQTDKHEDKASMDISGDDFAITDVVEDDTFLVTIADGEIQTLGTPETLSAVEISSFKQGDSLTADGTDYDYADAAEYDFETLEAYTDGTIINLKDMTYNVYLDAYGYVIGVVEVDEPDNYLFITGLNGNYDNLANVTYEANAIFLDGTMATITIDSRKSDFTDPDTKASVLSGDEDDATVNAWFTYSVNSRDVYTVDLVNYNAGVNEQGQSVEPDRDEVIDYKHDSTTDGDGYRVYGNDSTVYLTASVDAIQTGYITGTGARIDVVIDDVDSVAVGIDNVDIEPWDEDDVKADGKETANGGNYSTGLYTLYDEDGYIIAMVVVGEDNGNSDSLVYVHSGSLTRESYDRNTEEWTWTRDVIMDGEEAVLTEVDDTRVSMLNQMDENKWYRVRFNADGEVTSVRSDNRDQTPDGIDEDLDFDNWNMTGDSSYRYVDNHAGGAINTAINTTGVDIVLYHQSFQDNEPEQSGKTLYMTQDHNSYIRFMDDTSVVFEQMNNNEWDTFFWSGESGVARAIRELHDANAAGTVFDYTISAVIEDGRATTIIIRDEVKDGDSGTTPASDNEVEWNNEARGIINYIVEKGNAIPSLRDLRNDVVAFLDEEWNPDRGDYITDNQDGTYDMRVDGVNYVVLLDNSANETPEEPVVTTTEVKVVGINIYTANEDSNPVLVGNAIQKALEDEGYTNVTYEIANDGSITNIKAMSGGGTINFKYGDGEDGASEEVAFLESGESIADAVSNGAETIYLTDGEFKMSSKVEGDLTIIGDEDTVIVSTSENTAEDTGLYVTTGDLVVENVTFKGTGNGIVTITGFTGTVTIRNCTFDGVNNGIYLNGCAGGVISGCVFKDVKNSAIGIDTLTGTLTLSNKDYGTAGACGGDIEAFNDSEDKLVINDGAVVIDK